MAEEKKFTQEELDEKIKDRLAREQKKHAEELDKKQSEIDNLNKNLNDLKESYKNYDDEKAKSDQKIKDLESIISGYETASVKRKIAEEVGLDSKALEFITGDSEEEMKASAEKLKALTGTKTAPLATVETEKVNKLDAAFMELNEIIKGNN